MSKKKFSQFLVVLILFLFFGAGIIPTISGGYNDEQDISTLTFYTFDKTGTRKCEVDLPSVVVEDISCLFESIKKGITRDPFSAETESLKNDFVDILDIYNVIPSDLSKDDVFSLLTPKWDRWCVDNIPFSRGGVLPAQYSHRGSAFFCSIAGGGGGMLFPPIMLPRPRLSTFWAAYNYYALSVASNLYTGHGFAAGGPQFGMALGFWGIGLSFAVPGEPAVFGFGGYALAAWVMAGYVENYPPNQVPNIKEEQPSDGSVDVPLSISELSFRISDPDNDKMSYWVTTYPDIGSGEGHNKRNGVYSVPISGLENDEIYSWTVSVSDGEATVEKSFGFITEGRPPFDPFDDGWSYRKKITINHSQVEGDLEGFPVLVSLIDSDLAAKAQDDGDDILFMDGSGIAEKIYHEIEFFDSSSGEFVAWVNVHSVSSSVDTSFYMYYGNSVCDDQQFSERVWDQGYCGVWHLDDFRDSTLNGNHGTNHGTDDCSGIVGGAKDFVEGNKDYVSLGDMPEPASNSISTATFELWFNPEESDISGNIISKLDTSYEPDRKSYNLNLIGTGQIRFSAQSGTWVPGDDIIRFTTDDNLITNDIWQHICIVVDLSSRRGDIYYNGELQDSYEIILGNPPTHFYDVTLDDLFGRYTPESGQQKFIDGSMDEVRISKICRSEEWISTQYNNQKNPLNFYRVGPEE
jgi:hypothetical protein